MDQVMYEHNYRYVHPEPLNEATSLRLHPKFDLSCSSKK